MNTLLVHDLNRKLNFCLNCTTKRGQNSKLFSGWTKSTTDSWHNYLPLLCTFSDFFPGLVTYNVISLCIKMRK